MEKVLKYYLDLEILLGFPSQAEPQREKAELRGGADCVLLHVIYQSTTFWKKLRLI